MTRIDLTRVGQEIKTTLKNTIGKPLGFLVDKIRKLAQKIFPGTSKKSTGDVTAVSSEKLHRTSAESAFKPLPVRLSEMKRSSKNASATKPNSPEMLNLKDQLMRRKKELVHLKSQLNQRISRADLEILNDKLAKLDELNELKDALKGYRESKGLQVSAAEMEIEAKIEEIHLNIESNDFFYNLQDQVAKKESSIQEIQNKINALESYEKKLPQAEEIDSFSAVLKHGITFLPDIPENPKGEIKGILNELKNIKDKLLENDEEEEHLSYKLETTTLLTQDLYEQSLDVFSKSLNFNIDTINDLKEILISLNDLGTAIRHGADEKPHLETLLKASSKKLRDEESTLSYSGIPVESESTMDSSHTEISSDSVERADGTSSTEEETAIEDKTIDQAIDFIDRSMSLFPPYPPETDNPTTTLFDAKTDLEDMREGVIDKSASIVEYAIKTCNIGLNDKANALQVKIDGFTTHFQNILDKLESLEGEGESFSLYKREIQALQNEAITLQVPEPTNVSNIMQLEDLLLLHEQAENLMDAFEKKAAAFEL